MYVCVCVGGSSPLSPVPRIKCTSAFVLDEEGRRSGEWEGAGRLGGGGGRRDVVSCVLWRFIYYVGVIKPQLIATSSMDTQLLLPVTFTWWLPKTSCSLASNKQHLVSFGHLGLPPWHLVGFKKCFAWSGPQGSFCYRLTSMVLGFRPCPIIVVQKWPWAVDRMVCGCFCFR